MPATNRPSPPSGDQGVGAAMRAAREAGGIGLRELAKKLGYSAHSNLSDYESGKRLPSERLVADYERELGLEPGSLTKLLETAPDELADAPPAPPTPATADTASPVEADDGAAVGAAGPQARTGRPRWALVVGIGVASALVGAVVTFWVVTPPSTSPSPTQAGAALYSDGADPDAMGCEYDAVNPDRVNIYDPPQHLVGTLELRSSPKCGMSWPRFVPTVALTVSPTVRLHLDMHRPSDGATALFAVDFDGQPAYGNMLASREECVYATVTLVRNGLSTVPFATGCFRAPRS